MMNLYDTSGCFVCNTYTKLPSERFYIAKDPNTNKNYHLCPRCFSIASDKWDFSNPIGLSTGMVYQYVNRYLNTYSNKFANQFGNDYYTKAQRIAQLEGSMFQPYDNYNSYNQYALQAPSYDTYQNAIVPETSPLSSSINDVRSALTSAGRNLTSELSRLERNMLGVNLPPRALGTLKYVFDQLQRAILTMEIDAEQMIDEANKICEKVNGLSERYQGMTQHYSNPYMQQQYQHNHYSSEPRNQLTQFRNGPYYK